MEEGEDILLDIEDSFRLLVLRNLLKSLTTTAILIAPICKIYKNFMLQFKFTEIVGTAAAVAYITPMSFQM
jgi:hypothetical protein